VYFGHNVKVQDGKVTEDSCNEVLELYDDMIVRCVEALVRDAAKESQPEVAFEQILQKTKGLQLPDEAQEMLNQLQERLTAEREAVSLEEK